MSFPKISDYRDQRKIFPDINKNEINLDYYDLCETEESNVVYRRNIYKVFPDLNLMSIPDLSVPYNNELFYLSKFLKNYPENVKKEELSRFEKLSSLYLLHGISDFSNFTGKLYDFEKALKTSIDNNHPSVARTIGYTFKQSEDTQNKLYVLTERPVNGSLYSVYNILSKCNQSKKFKILSKCNQSKKFKILSKCNQPYDGNPAKLSNEEKYLIILGILCGIHFIHQKGFVHSKLDPTTIFLNEQLHSVICNYEFKHEGQKINDDISLFCNFPEFISPETHQNQIITQKNDIFSFGMLIYYILTEKLPFEKMNLQIIKQKIIKGYLPSLPDTFGECWSALFIACCNSEPAARPESKEIILELFDKEKMNEYVKAMSKDYEPNFTDAQLSYISLLYDLYKNISGESSDFDIFYYIDRDKILPKDMETFMGCNQLDINCLKTVAYYFLNGECNYPNDELIALEIFQKAAELNDPESTKMVAKLYYKNWANKNELETSLAYYQKSLELYEGNETECEKIQEKIKKIEEKLAKADEESLFQSNKDDDDDDDEKPRKKVTFDIDRTITFCEISNYTTKDDLINFFRDYNNIEVKIEPHGNFTSAKITFESVKDKKSVLKRYKNDKYKYIFRIHNEQMKLLPTKHMIQLQRANRRVRGAPLGSPLTPQQFSNHAKRMRFDLNNYYPGPGKKDGEYEIIGHGTFGIVYKVYDKKTNEVFIAKVLKNEFQDLSDRKNFRRENSIQTEIRHPLIIRLYGYEMHSIISPNSNKPTLIMEYAPNNTLDSVIKAEHPPDWWNKTTQIKAIIGIAHAMAFMHSRQYIHRDLKPANILFDINHEIKIGDFGCSRKFDGIYGMTAGIAGTPLYRAPELVNMMHSCYSYEVDVYSFGYILLEILTGKPIKAPTNNVYKFFKNFVLKGWRPNIPHNLDESMKTMINLCWSKFVNDRPSFQEIFNFFKSIYDGPLNEDSFFSKDVNIEDVKNFFQRLESYEY